MAHVHVQHLGSGDREHDGGQREERDREVASQEPESVARRQRLQDRRVGGYATHADQADHGEPDAHDGPEQPPYGARTQSLHEKQADDDRHGDRNDQVGH